MERVIDTFYPFQMAEIDGERTIGKQDAFRAFMERDSSYWRPARRLACSAVSISRQ